MAGGRADSKNGPWAVDVGCWGSKLWSACLCQTIVFGHNCTPTDCEVGTEAVERKEHVEVWGRGGKEEEEEGQEEERAGTTLSPV